MLLRPKHHGPIRVRAKPTQPVVIEAQVRTERAKDTDVPIAKGAKVHHVAVLVIFGIRVELENLVAPDKTIAARPPLFPVRITGATVTIFVPRLILGILEADPQWLRIG